MQKKKKKSQGLQADNVYSLGLQFLVANQNHKTKICTSQG